MLLAQALTSEHMWVSRSRTTPWHQGSGSWAGRGLRGLIGRFDDPDRIVVFDSDRGPLTSSVPSGRKATSIWPDPRSRATWQRRRSRRGDHGLAGRANGRSREPNYRSVILGTRV